jgi:hypothetical protein
MSINPTTQRNTRNTPRRRTSRSTPLSPRAGTRLVPLVLKRPGHADEIFYVPECAACRKPILNFRCGNVSVVNEAERDAVPIGKVDDAEAFEIISDGAFTFHKECDESGHSPWVTSHCVFRNDQRREFEIGGVA